MLPTSFYHGTSNALLPSILENGLVPGLKKGADAWAKKHRFKLSKNVLDSRPPSVFMAGNFEGAEFYALKVIELLKNSKPIILRLSFPRKWLSRILHDELDYDGYRIPEIVPPSFIKKVYDL